MKYKVGDKVYIKIEDIAAHDIDVKFRAYPRGRVWWEHAHFSQDSSNIVVSRLVICEGGPINNDRSWKLRQMNATFGEGRLMEIAVNQALIDLMEYSSVESCFVPIVNPSEP